MRRSTGCRPSHRSIRAALSSVAATVPIHLGFGATSKLMRSCALDVTKNRSRHRFGMAPDVRLRGLGPSWTNVQDRIGRSSKPRKFCFNSGNYQADRWFACQLEPSWPDGENGDCGFWSCQTEDVMGQSPLPAKTGRAIGSNAGRTSLMLPNCRTSP
jgi:hypothetical protein